MSSGMGKRCNELFRTGFRRAPRHRTAPHFATKFEPHLRTNRIRQIRNYVCDTPVATNAVKIARRWVLVSPILLDGFFNAAQATAEEELERVGGALAGKESSENDLLESQPSPSSSSDPSEKNKGNDSNGYRAEQEMSSRSSQKPPGDSATGGDGLERDNVNSLPTSSSTVPSGSSEGREEAKTKRQSLVLEEERPKVRRQGKGRIRELEELKAELAEKEVELLEKEKELLQQEQTLKVLQEELEIERKIRALVTKQKEEAEEEAALAMGLCVGGSMLP